MRETFAPTKLVSAYWLFSVMASKNYFEYDSGSISDLRPVPKCIKVSHLDAGNFQTENHYDLCT